MRPTHPADSSRYFPAQNSGFCDVQVGAVTGGARPRDLGRPGVPDVVEGVGDDPGGGSVTGAGLEEGGKKQCVCDGSVQSFEARWSPMLIILSAMTPSPPSVSYPECPCNGNDSTRAG